MLNNFNPFENLKFDSNICFLSGETLTSQHDTISVFPEWLMQQFQLHDKSFTMIDFVTPILYKNLILPCSENVKNKFNQLDLEIQEVFQNGYNAIKLIDEQKLFLWMSRIIYGILYHDLKLEKEKKELKNDILQISESLKNKFHLFHLMLQSIIYPIQFSEQKPWSIAIVGVKYSKDVFNFRGDPIKLIFSLGLNGFGIVASLHDNGFVKEKESELLNKIGDTILHPIQFEELIARFNYNHFLLKKQPKYNINETQQGILIHSLLGSKNDDIDSVFHLWNDNIFADVLTDYWKPWGLQKKDIISFPNAPISFLEHETTYQFISPDTISYPF